jgi:hypothetical protein
LPGSFGVAARSAGSQGDKAYGIACNSCRGRLRRQRAHKPRTAACIQPVGALARAASGVVRAVRLAPIADPTILLASGAEYA